MSEVGEPDVAFERFEEFFSKLGSGVRVMSLMLAEHGLTRDLIETMAFAPKLAADLARRPALMDSMLEPSFRAPVSRDDSGVSREKRLVALLHRAGSFEDQLNAARRFHREEAFRIGYQLLRGAINASEAGAAYADLADACVIALAEACEKETSCPASRAAIGKWAICALGKFGGRELTVSSDLDLMLIYEPVSDTETSLASRASCSAWLRPCRARPRRALSTRSTCSCARRDGQGLWRSSSRRSRTTTEAMPGRGSSWR